MEARLGLLAYNMYSINRDNFLHQYLIRFKRCTIPQLFFLSIETSELKMTPPAGDTRIGNNMPRESIDRYVSERNEFKHTKIALEQRRAVLLRQLQYPLKRELIEQLDIDNKLKDGVYYRSHVTVGTQLAWYCMFIRNADSMWIDEHGVHIDTPLLPKKRIAVMSYQQEKYLLWHAAEDVGKYRDITFMPHDVQFRAYIKLRAARLIQRAVREWFWQPKYGNGHVGFHARKGWRDVTDLNEMNREK